MNQHLIELYIQHTLTNQKSPESVFLFAKEAGITESEFYNHYASLHALESDIFAGWWTKTAETASANEVYQNYSAHEKVLALFFTWIEHLRNHRSFVVYLYNRDAKQFPPKLYPNYLKALHEKFNDTIKPILGSAIDNKEIVDRKYLSDKYADGLWANFLFVTNFWLKDESKGFEKTDESIEKSVNLAFELMGKSALDSALEFGKFLFQNK
ncbi:MAG: TetR/AcrR family transcriptional regulator [Bacteroidia bacterium]